MVRTLTLEDRRKIELMILYIRVEDYGPKPTQGKLMKLNKKLTFSIQKCDDEGGIYRTLPIISSINFSFVFLAISAQKGEKRHIFMWCFSPASFLATQVGAGEGNRTLVFSLGS